MFLPFSIVFSTIIYFYCCLDKVKRPLTYHMINWNDSGWYDDDTVRLVYTKQYSGWYGDTAARFGVHQTVFELV